MTNEEVAKRLERLEELIINHEELLQRVLIDVGRAITHIEHVQEKESEE